jgi:aminoglycoside phosphotransferase (APT) family kinase protein
LTKLHAAGFAVAKPLCVEAGPEYINGAFMISERLRGSVDFTAWKSDRQSVLTIARQFAELLARLHRMDPETVGFSAQAGARSAYDCMRDEINRFYSLYRRKMHEEQPLIELAFAWLLKNIPESLKQRPARLLHGDAGFHNLLVEQGSISALLDWEYHHLGDPIEELCYARQFITQVMQWEEFMDFYQAAGGMSYPLEDDFFSVWTIARNPVGCVDSVALFDDEQPDTLQLAVAGYIFGPRLQVSACERILEILGKPVNQEHLS